METVPIITGMELATPTLELELEQESLQLELEEMAEEDYLLPANSIQKKLPKGSSQPPFGGSLWYGLLDIASSA